MQQGLATRKTIGDMIDVYHDAMADFKEADARIKSAKKKLDGIHDGLYVIMQRYRYSGEFDYNMTERAVTQRLWLYFIDLLGIRKYLSIQKAKELDEQIEKMENVPELTVENVQATLWALADKSNEFLEETIKEVASLLMPGLNRYDDYKTNRNDMIGEKVILSGFIQWSFSGKVSYYYRPKLNALDRVFYGLDQKIVPERTYHGELVDAINTSDGEGETPYFRFKCFKNGNLHLWFKRMDIVTELNRVLGGGHLHQ